MCENYQLIYDKTYRITPNIHKNAYRQHNSRNNNLQIFLNNGITSISFLERHSRYVIIVARTMEKITRYQPISFKKTKENKLVMEKYKKSVDISAASPIDFFLFWRINLQKRNTTKKTTTGYMTKTERILTIVLTFFIHFT